MNELNFFIYFDISKKLIKSEKSCYIFYHTYTCDKLYNNLICQLNRRYNFLNKYIKYSKYP